MCAQSTLPATCLIYLPNAPGLVIRDRDAMVGVGSIGITKTADGSHRLHWVMQKETGRFMMMESASAESTQASMMNVMQADGSVVQSASHSAMSAALENMYRSEHNVSGKYVATKIEDGGITHSMLFGKTLACSLLGFRPRRTKKASSRRCFRRRHRRHPRKTAARSAARIVRWIAMLHLLRFLSR